MISYLHFRFTIYEKSEIFLVHIVESMDSSHPSNRNATITMNMLNRYLLVFFGLTLPILSYAQSTVWADSKIDSVTVYLEGALVHRSFTVNTQTGENNVRFEGLTATMETSTIVIGMEGGLTPSSVSTEQNNWNPYGIDVRYTELKDSLDALQWEIEFINNEVLALKEELAVLQENRKLNGGNIGVSLSSLEEISTYMRTRTLAIQRELSEKNRDQNQWKQKRQVIQQEINRYKSGIPQFRKGINFMVRTDRPQQLKGTLSYFVTGANWNAEYDVKVADLDSDLKITYKANVYNGTYEDWNNVSVRVSTATPSLNVSLPKLSVWRLDPNSSRREQLAFSAQRQADFSQNIVAPSLEEDGWGDSEGAWDDMAATSAQAGVEAVEAGEIAVEFTIDDRITLKGNYEQRVYDLQEMQAPAGYEHYAIPKLGKSVYLIARVPDWNQLNLLSGKANIYLNNRYTGQSNINIRNVTDTLEFSLGIDPQVLVSRKLEDDFTEKILIGTKTRERKGYRLYVKNSRNDVINIRILDQHPISAQEDVEVELTNPGGAATDEETGELLWDLTLSPGDVWETKFTFEVVYPKNARVQLYQPRMKQRAARFSY
ncbi:MAG TPA: hypothetical protein DCE41_26850 [Cytophagales bacterium]|nr:hypothetical protein [Cytophagales bacterium]HAA22590.1 hypothetical protein [Cytophagales bacterium]HAP63537.1 hypothetical protein [Cytophagales bacterium]